MRDALLAGVVDAEHLDVVAEVVKNLPDSASIADRELVESTLATQARELPVAPQARWEATGFLPRLPESLEQLDLLLLTVAKARQVRRLELAVRELNRELKEARVQTRQAQERHLAHLMKDS